MRMYCDVSKILENYISRPKHLPARHFLKIFNLPTHHFVANQGVNGKPDVSECGHLQSELAKQVYVDISEIGEMKQLYRCGDGLFANFSCG